MMKKIIPFLLICVCGLVREVSAQDIHYSQFYMAPTILNPAMTGVMECTDRFAVNYRNQWAPALTASSAFNTFSAAYDHKFTVGRNDYWGLGVTLLGDIAGEARLQTYQGSVSASYSKYLGGNRTSSHYLVFGAEGTAGFRQLGYQNLRFGVQHDGEGRFDATLPNGEIDLIEEGFFYPDVSAGLLYFTTFNQSSFYIGGAYHHILRPNISFYNSDGGAEYNTRMYSKFTGHLGGEFRMGSGNASLVPGVVTMFQGPSWQLNLGTALRWYIGSQRYNKQSFQIGVWTRLVNNYAAPEFDSIPLVPENKYKLGADAVILATRFEYNQVSLGLSYDLNVSKLAESSPGNGSFEFTLLYLICGPEQRGVYCPSF